MPRQPYRSYPDEDEYNADIEAAKKAAYDRGFAEKRAEMRASGQLPYTEAEYQGWVAEGAKEERERIKAIDDLGLDEHPDLVKAAKFDTAITAPELAVLVIKRRRAQQGLA